MHASGHSKFSLVTAGLAFATIVLAFSLTLNNSAYGSESLDDNRYEPWEVDDLPHISNAVKATAMFVRRSDVAKLSVTDPSEPGRCRLLGRTFAQRYSLCPGERFADQPAPAYCSGVLVGSDILVTAGHCMRSPIDCAGTAVVFDFTMARGSTTRDLTVPATSVYVCSSIISRAHDRDTGLDFAVIRLNRPVQGRIPIPMRAAGQVEADATLATIGYQSGLPVKISTEGRIRTTSKTAFFTATLGITDGSSGSPVIDMDTGLLEGIVVRGPTAFEWADSCFRTKICDDLSCRGEDVTRATQFYQYIP